MGQHKQTVRCTIINKNADKLLVCPLLCLVHLLRRSSSACVMAIARCWTNGQLDVKYNANWILRVFIGVCVFYIIYNGLLTMDGLIKYYYVLSLVVLI